MEIQIKKTIKAGNSSAVVLPRAWLNKEVRVELIKKTPETILFDVINIVKKHINLKNIKGIYLTGSYARGEEDENSDIDVLVVTNDIDKEMIKEGIYNVLIISSELLKQKLDYDLFPVGQMIKEAEPLLNSNYLDSIEVKVTKKNIKWYLNTTEEKLKIIKKVLDRTKNKNKKNISDLVAYTLILRKIIKKISKGTNSYERYLAVKNNLKEKNGINIDEAQRLYGYLKNQQTKVRKLVGGLVL